MSLRVCGESGRSGRSSACEPHLGGAPAFTLAGTLVVGSFIYVCYASFCGNLFLLGKWDFNGWRTWPISFLLLRDAAVLFCLGSGVFLLVASARRQLAAWRRTESAP